jgi:hypothetical protein
MASARSTGILAGQLSALYHLGAAGALTDGQLLEQFLARNVEAPASESRHSYQGLHVGDLHAPENRKLALLIGPSALFH